MLSRRLEGLFAAMARGGDFGADEIPYFNGGLFADADVVPLVPEEINILLTVAGYNWSGVEPSIFGTLFERTLDPGKRSQIGAHYFYCARLRPFAAYKVFQVDAQLSQFLSCSLAVAATCRCVTLLPVLDGPGCRLDQRRGRPAAKPPTPYQ
jgi:hypothetical protein